MKTLYEPNDNIFSNWLQYYALNIGSLIINTIIEVLEISPLVEIASFHMVTYSDQESKYLHSSNDRLLKWAYLPRNVHEYFTS